MKETTPKEKMLKKIRKALLEKRDNPYPNLEDLPLYPEYQDHIDLLFAEQLTAVNGTFIFCENEIQLVENLLLLAEEKKWRRIYCWEPYFQHLLGRYEFPFYSTDTEFMQAEVGITGCEALVARNGSIMISNANASGRRLSVYPHVHIVIAYTSQLVLDLKDAFLVLREKYQGNMPTLISNITGPSRTADIEKTLVLGAHGPKELYVILLEG